jgi:hypothetical protein
VIASVRLVAERETRIADLGQSPPWWRPIARRRWSKRHAEIMAMDVSVYTEWCRSVYSDALLRELAARPAIDYGNLRGPIARHPGSSHGLASGRALDDDL